MDVLKEFQAAIEIERLKTLKDFDEQIYIIFSFYFHLRQYYQINIVPIYPPQKNTFSLPKLYATTTYQNLKRANLLF